VDDIEEIRQRLAVMAVVRTALENENAILKLEMQRLLDRCQGLQAERDEWYLNSKKLAQELIQEKVEYAKLTEEIERGVYPRISPSRAVEPAALAAR